MGSGEPWGGGGMAALETTPTLGERWEGAVSWVVSGTGAGLNALRSVKICHAGVGSRHAP
jgi:hypothetical protein